MLGKQHGSLAFLCEGNVSKNVNLASLEPLEKIRPGALDVLYLPVGVSDELLLVLVAALLHQRDGALHIGGEVQQVPHFPVVEAETEIRIIGSCVLIILSSVFFNGIAITAEQRITRFCIVTVIERH